MGRPPRISLTSVRLTRQAESSRLQLEHVRRAFELLVPVSRHPVAKTHSTSRRPRSAAGSRESIPKG